MKKILLPMGTILATLSPAIAVVSCGQDNPITDGLPGENKNPQPGGKTPAPNGVNPGGSSAHTEQSQELSYKVGDISAMNRSELQNILDQLLDTKTTATIDDFKSQVNQSTITDANKVILNNLVDYYQNVETTWHIINFVLQATNDSNLRAASIGWKLDGPYQVENADALAEMTSFIKDGGLKIDEIVNSIVEKFSGTDTNFNTAILALSYTVAQNVPHSLVKGVAYQAADNAMGGTETLKYILSSASEPWSIIEANEDVAGSITVTNNQLQSSDQPVATVHSYEAFEGELTSSFFSIVPAADSTLNVAMDINDIPDHHNFIKLVDDMSTMFVYDSAGDFTQEKINEIVSNDANIIQLNDEETRINTLLTNDKKQAIVALFTDSNTRGHAWGENTDLSALITKENQFTYQWQVVKNDQEKSFEISLKIAINGQEKIIDIGTVVSNLGIDEKYLAMGASTILADQEMLSNLLSQANISLPDSDSSVANGSPLNIDTSNFSSVSDLLINNVIINTYKLNGEISLNANINISMDQNQLIVSIIMTNPVTSTATNVLNFAIEAIMWHNNAQWHKTAITSN